ncbi:MAG: exonuclease SbcCD subunit D [Porcipelethomonas sp.]
MKFIHISDLHIGKRVNGISMIDDQKIILKQIMSESLNHECRNIIIAGDIYDKPSPSAEAMEVFDSFVSDAAKNNIRLYIVSGNHDSAERISYYSEVVASSGIHVCGKYNGKLKKICTDDEFGEINIYLLPFIRPSNVKAFFPESKIESYEDAVKIAVNSENIDYNKRNILVCHQFITGAETCESEEFAIGGLDNVSAEIFEKFDYTAAGHIHGQQFIKQKNIRYSGSPLKYSFSEENHKKCMLLIEIKEKNDFNIKKIPFVVPHDMRTVKGSFDAIMDMPYSEDYINAVITDEEVYPDTRADIATVFPNMMKFSIENSKTSDTREVVSAYMENKSINQIFTDFYMMQNNNVPPSEKHLAMFEKILNEMEMDV